MKRIRKNASYYLDKNIEINDDIVRQYFNNIYQNSKKCIKKCIDEKIYNYINNRFNDSESFEESRYRIEHFMEHRPVCEFCGKPIKFTISKLHYPKYCTKLCEGYNISPFKNKEILNKIKNTLIDKYGVDHNWKDKNCRDKCKLTMINRYGVDNPAKSEKIKEKIKNTVRLKYGVDFPALNKEICAKQQNTLKKLYGGPWHPEKVLNTNMKKYGHRFYTETKQMIEYNASILKIRLEKEYITKRKNNSFNTSKHELILLTYIKSFFPNVIFQYKSNEYPFKCDYYIPELKLYIEYLGSWTHGGHPFNISDKNDIKKLNLWKLKNTKFYNVAIDVWINRDVNKRNIAKLNNLNYKELWNLEEAKHFIDSLIK